MPDDGAHATKMLCRLNTRRHWDYAAGGPMAEVEAKEGIAELPLGRGLARFPVRSYVTNSFNSTLDRQTAP